MRSVITRRLSAASKRPHLPTCSQNKDTLIVGKSQGKEAETQHFLIALLGLYKNKAVKTTQCNIKRGIEIKLTVCYTN
jgi:hypothetical protein